MSSGFATLKKVIDRILSDYGLESAVKENLAIAYWPDVVGKKIAEATEPWKVADGKLFVRVLNPTWRVELAFLKQEIAEKLNRKIGQRVIKEVIFV